MARIGLMMGMMMMRLKSHFLKRCSLSERLKKECIAVTSPRVSLKVATPPEYMLKAGAKNFKATN